MKNVHRLRRMIVFCVAVIGVVVAVLGAQDSWQPVVHQSASPVVAGTVQQQLQTLPVKGRAPKTGYMRTQFGDGWAKSLGCDTRNIILHRDLKNATVSQDCKVQSGTLDDPYTGKQVLFKRGAGTSTDVQIDHVVALSDAWQKGAQALSHEERIQLANDPLELLAVDGPANQAKSDGDAATWLPPNKAFRCQYVTRQIAVKIKYRLWVTQAEHDVMAGILAQCPGQTMPVK